MGKRKRKIAYVPTVKFNAKDYEDKKMRKKSSLLLLLLLFIRLLLE